jgi:hypothetical protein
LLQLVSRQELQENLTDANETFQQCVFVCVDEELVFYFEAIKRVLEIKMEIVKHLERVCFHQVHLG